MQPVLQIEGEQPPEQARYECRQTEGDGHRCPRAERSLSRNQRAWCPGNPDQAECDHTEAVPPSAIRVNRHCDPSRPSYAFWSGGANGECKRRIQFIVASWPPVQGSLSDIREFAPVRRATPSARIRSFLRWCRSSLPGSARRRRTPCPGRDTIRIRERRYLYWVLPTAPPHPRQRTRGMRRSRHTSVSLHSFRKSPMLKAVQNGTAIQVWSSTIMP